MGLIDRKLIYSYLKAYLICLVSLLSLYIVVDLFTNIEDFTHNQKSPLTFLRHVGTYYGYRSFQIFDRLNEAIALLAAMFTVAWMQRNNELVPFLSAGVRAQRVVRPILMVACAMLGLGILNQEMVLPRIGASLTAGKEDPDSEQVIAAPWAFDTNGVHVDGVVAQPKGMIVKGFSCTIPGTLGPSLILVMAEEARYIPPGPGAYQGGWLLTGARPAELEAANRPSILEQIDPGKYFLHTEEADFARVIRGRKWFYVYSTYQLYKELAKSNTMQLATVAVYFHMRLTRPILGLLLIFLGLSVILRDQNRNVFVSAGLCLVMCALLYAAINTCKFLGDNDFLQPALAAWLPVFLCGPVTFALFESIHT